MPASTLRYMESWRKWCPDYEIRRWDESNFDVHCNAFVSEAYEAGKWAFVSDVARLYALVNCGGVYFDTDVEVLKPIDDLLRFEAFTAFESKYQIGMGILGCVKGQVMFKELLEQYENSHFKKDDNSFDTAVIGRRFKEICLKYGFVPDGTLQTINGLTILSKEYFYPSDIITKEFVMTGNTYTVHYYDASWVSPVDIYGISNSEKFRMFPKRIRPGVVRFVGIVKYEGIFKAFRWMGDKIAEMLFHRK